MRYIPSTVRGFIRILVAFLCLVSGIAADPSDYVTFQKAREQFRRGFIFYNNMQYLAAVDHFRKAVGVYPEYITARDYLARSYSLAGYTSAALAEFSQLKELVPDNPSVAFRMDSLRMRTEGSGRVSLSELVMERRYKSADFRGQAFTTPVDITVDEERRIYITSFESGRICIIDGNGRGVDTWRTSAVGRAFGIDYYKGKIVVSDFRSDRVTVFSTDGKRLASFGEPGSAEGQFHGPEGLCFDGRGYLYVVDSGNDRVQKFDERGNFMLQFGRGGAGDGELEGPTDVAVLGGKVYITDTGNSRISVFDDCGNYIDNITPGLDRPRGISRWEDRLLISDEKKGLLIWNPSDNSKKWFRSWGEEEETFSRLTASIADRDGYLYCLDNHASEVVLFSPLTRRYSNLAVDITSVDVSRFPTVAWYINVRGADGRPVYNLDSTNFRVTEDGSVLRNVSPGYLKKKKPSLSVELLVDRSEGARSWKGDVPWMSDFILSRMRRDDSLRIVNFNSDVWQANPFDWSRRRALKTLKKADYGQGRRTGKALYETLSDLLLKNTRRAVVLVTDGVLEEDSFRDYSPEIVIDYARAHFIPVFIISFREPHPDLVRIASDTGGEVYRPGDLTGLRGLYDKLKKSEEYRYVLLYSTFKLPSFKGWWSDVSIEVSHKGQRGIEWGGYFVP